jgi:integrase
MTKKTTLTVNAIEALKTGLMGDPLTPGLAIERLGSGKLVWQYKRRVPAKDSERRPLDLAGAIVKMAGGSYPATSIGAARQWAAGLNAKVEAGIDPRVVERELIAAVEAEKMMTVDAAHAIYMEAVNRNEHKTVRSRKAKPLKPRTITEKLALYDRNVKPTLGTRPLRSIVQADLDAIVTGMGSRGSRIQANRVGAEMRVFFAFCCSRRGRAAGVGIDVDPTVGIGELWYPEEERDRWLDGVELPLFLKALKGEERLHQRALLLLLLTGCRKMEVLDAPMNEYQNGVWVIPGSRTKNGSEHPIALGPWGRSLIVSGSEWVIPSPKIPTQPMTCGWPKVLESIGKTMSTLGGYGVKHFTLHDLRRTMRSHVEDHGIDETLAERMINHTLVGLAKRYNRGKRTEAMAAGFAKWEAAVIAMAQKAGVAVALGVPSVTKVAEIPTTPLRLAA